MKHHVPQFDLPLGAEDFRLAPEHTADGDRITAENQERRAARAAADQLQPELPGSAENSDL